MDEKLLQRIVVDPRIMIGKPVIRGTRVPVEAVVSRLAEGMTIRDILKDYPRLTKDDVRAALVYSAVMLRGEEVSSLARKARIGHTASC